MNPVEGIIARLTEGRVERFGSAVLILGDCMDIMPLLPPSDVLLTDQPYPDLSGGIALKSSKRGGSGVGRDAGVTLGDPWQASLDWLPVGWAACERALITFCTFHSVGRIQENLESLGGTAASLLTWNKPNAPHPARNSPRHSGEHIWLFRKAPGLDWRAIDDTVISLNGLQAGCMASPERVLKEGSKQAAHPTQKPLALMRKLLGIKPASVLDPFMGTGTTGLAAASMGIPFVGIEKDPAYFEMAVARFRALEGDLLAPPLGLAVKAALEDPSHAD